MSEIGLRDYFAKLEQLLNATAADEVIHHCRHILQYYPKSVDAYRFLGRALLINGRWDEAMSALRRVLSVIPDDYQAHLGLSEIYDHKQKADEAIWHLERAFEHNPNSRELLERVRTLYRRYRDVDQLKVQLTAAAVARQAERNHAFDQAVETLRDALTRQPDRIDLRVLLAHVLWESGDHVEAAETALDVLQSLPDCLEANRILTALWLEEERPSDAQRYLNRVEAIDPYIAVELAQGQSVSNDTFRLEELDYQRAAQSLVAGDRPAWLENITADSTPQTTQASDDDWTGFMSSMLANSATAAPETTDRTELPTSDDLFADDWMQESVTRHQGSALDDDDEIPAEFATLEAPSFDLFGEDLPSEDLFAGEFSTGTSATGTGDDHSPFESDPMAWMRDSGISDEDEAPASADDDLFGSTPQTDGLSWMQDDEFAETGTNTSRPQPNADAFSWMENFDIELVEDTSQPASSVFTDSPAEPSTADQDEVPEWLRDDNSLEEALGIEQLTQIDAAEDLDWLNSPASFEQTPDDALDDPFGSPSAPTVGTSDIPNLFDDFDDLGEPEDDTLTGISAPSLQGSEQEEPPQGVPGPRRGLTAMLDEANFSWMKDQESQDDIMSDAVMDDWLTQFGASPTSDSATASQDPGWLNELDTAMNDKDNLQHNSDETPDWLSGTGDTPTPETPAEEDSIASDSFDWMTNTSSESDATQMADWMSQMDALNSSAPASPSGEPAPSSGSGTETSQDDFNWSEDAFDSVGSDEDEAQPADVPDWLSELAPTSTFEIPSPEMNEQQNESDDGFTWLSDEPAVSTGESPAQSSDYGWLDETGIDSEPEETSLDDLPAASAETPDWLTNLNLDAAPETTPDAAIGQDTESDLSPKSTWFDEIEIEAEAGADAIEAEADAIADASSAADSDWMAELGLNLEPSTAQETQATSSSDGFSWLDSVENDNELPAEQDGDIDDALPAELPDWLTELEIGESPSELAAEESDAEHEAEALPAAESGDFDWLSEIEPSAEAEAVSTEASDSDWLDELTSAPPTSFAIEETGDAQTAPTGAFDNTFETANADTADEDLYVAASPVSATSDGFDWLNDLQPEREQDEDSLEPADASWLSELDAETEAPEAETTPSPQPDLPEETPVEIPTEIPSEISADAIASETGDSGTLEPDAQPVAAESDWLSELLRDDESASDEDAAADEPDETELAEAGGPALASEHIFEVDAAAPTQAEASSADDEWDEDLEPALDDDLVPSYLLDDERADDANDEDEFWLNEEHEQAAIAAGERVPEETAAELTALTAAQALDTLPDDELDEESELGPDLESEEEFEPAPATNAPDWLNAMVPGLDVDYEVAEEEPLETEPVSEVSENGAEDEHEFAWVEDIVDEESRQLESAAETSRSRFVFSRPPAWLSRLTKRSGKRDDELPDWPTDDPDWQP